MIWSSAQFRFVRLSDRCTTGCCIMPQKKNPDAAELLRAKLGRILGRHGGALHRHEGPAADLFQGHAGGQGTGLRRRRHADAGARRDDRHGARHDRQPRRRWPPPPPRASPPPPTSPTGWCARLACRSARRITSPARWWRMAEAQGLRPARPDAGRDAGGPSRHHATRSSPCSAWKTRSRSRTSYGGTAPDQVRAQIARWKESLA